MSESKVRRPQRILTSKNRVPQGKSKIFIMATGPLHRYSNEAERVEGTPWDEIFSILSILKIQLR